MYRKIMLTAVSFLLVLSLAACGGTEAETEGDVQGTEETTETVVETEETAAETQKEVTFTNYKKLTVTEDSRYEGGLLYITFSDKQVRFLEQDTCAIGLSGDGEAWSITGTLDMGASEAFKDGDFYTGVVVKPSEALEAGDYKLTVTIADYLMGFSLQIQ